MYLLITSFLLLLQDPQFGFDNRSRLPELEGRKSVQSTLSPSELQEAENRREAVLNEYYFTQRFNKFLKKLNEFSESYNQGNVDVKRVDAVRKAWQDLEKTDGWFHRTKNMESMSRKENGPARARR